MATVKTRQLAIVLLAAALSLATVSVSYGAGRQMERGAQREPIGVWQEVKSIFGSLFGVPGEKSGSSLDPDGRAQPAPGTGTSSPAGGTTSDSGSSLDPDGKK
jgi:hypothetical protein